MPTADTQRNSVLTESHEQRIRELWEAVDEIRSTKQNKFTAVAWVPMLVYLVSVTVGGVWGAATLSANMASLEQTVRAGTVERYHASTAKADFALRDKDIRYNKDAIDRIEKSVERIERGVDRITDHVTENHQR